jgi:stage V sporulation protein G
MEITEVRVSLVNDTKLRARVTITFDRCFVVRGIKVIDGNHGTFVAFPSRRKPDGTYQDYCHPINPETRDVFESKILDRYEEEMARREERRAQSRRGPVSVGAGREREAQVGDDEDDDLIPPEPPPLSYRL